MSATRLSCVLRLDLGPTATCCCSDGDDLGGGSREQMVVWVGLSPVQREVYVKYLGGQSVKEILAGTVSSPLGAIQHLKKVGWVVVGVRVISGLLGEREHRPRGGNALLRPAGPRFPVCPPFWRRQRRRRRHQEPPPVCGSLRACLMPFLSQHDPHGCPAPCLG